MPVWFSGIYGYLISAGVAALIAGAGTGYVIHRMDQEKYLQLQLADANAQKAAIQEAKDIQSAQDKSVLNAAVNEAQAQQKIVTVTNTIQKRIPVYVPEGNDGCIAVGLVKLLNAAANNDPSAISAPATKLDDSCAAVSWRSFADDISDDYAIGHQNAEQLNALIASVTALHDAATKPH